MYYNSKRPIFLMETDWSPETKDPKDYSLSKDMADKEIPIDLPENEFIAGLAAEKLIYAVKDQKKAAEKAKAYADSQKKEAGQRKETVKKSVELASAITKATAEVIKDEVDKAAKKEPPKTKEETG